MAYIVQKIQIQEWAIQEVERQNEPTLYFINETKWPRRTLEINSLEQLDRKMLKELNYRNVILFKNLDQTRHPEILCRYNEMMREIYSALTKREVFSADTFLQYFCYLEEKMRQEMKVSSSFSVAYQFLCNNLYTLVRMVSAGDVSRDNFIVYKKKAETLETHSIALFIAQYYVHNAHTQAIASRIFEKLANQGNPEAQYTLAAHFYLGSMGRLQDLKKVFYYAKLAADQGDMRAQHECGVTYFYGEVKPANYEKALHYFRLAANQGFMESQANYCWMYQLGQGTKKNQIMGAYYWRNFKQKNAAQNIKPLASQELDTLLSDLRPIASLSSQK